MKETKISKEQVGVYESVMGRKLSKEELSKIHKEATTSFENLDKEDFKSKVGWIFIGSVLTLLVLKAFGVF